MISARRLTNSLLIAGYPAGRHDLGTVPMDLNGRTALVTGASSGIGAACAKELSAAGARVIVCGRDEGRLEAVAQQLSTPVAVLPFDVRDPDGLQVGIGSLGDEWARVDVLVSNAGVAVGSRLLADSDPADSLEMVQVNLLGALHVIQTVLPGMLRRASGHVVTIGSIAGRQEYAGGAVYGATKAALGRLSAALRLELAGKGVRVSHVDPGLTETDLWLRRFDGDTSKVAAMFEGVQPLQAEDVSSAVLWLLTRPEHVSVAELFLVPADRPTVGKKPMSK